MWKLDPISSKPRFSLSEEEVGEGVMQRDEAGKQCFHIKTWSAQVYHCNTLSDFNSGFFWPSGAAPGTGPNFVIPLQSKWQISNCHVSSNSQLEHLTSSVLPGVSHRVKTPCFQHNLWGGQQQHYSGRRQCFCVYVLLHCCKDRNKRPPLDYGDVCMRPLLLQRLPKRNPTCLPTPLQGPQSCGTHDTPGNSGQLCLDGSLYIGRSFFWSRKVSNIPFFNITPNGQLACARYNSKGQNTNLLSPTAQHKPAKSDRSPVPCHWQHLKVQAFKCDDCQFQGGSSRGACRRNRRTWVWIPEYR